VHVLPIPNPIDMILKTTHLRLEPVYLILDLPDALALLNQWYKVSKFKRRLATSLRQLAPSDPGLCT
jgi:hypothetical protein